MATPFLVGSRHDALPRISGFLYDWLIIAAIVWFVGGAYLDAWAHINIPALETFFTPWHAVLYSGMLALMGVQIVCILINRVGGSSWREAIPAGHLLTLYATLGFLVAGVGDLIWHILFGVEQSIDAQFSPTHTALFICFVVIASGPYRALALRRDEQRTRWMIPLVQLLLLGTAHLFLFIVHPYINLYPFTAAVSQSELQLLGFIGYLFYGMVLTAMTLYTLRRWRVPFGFFTLVYTVTAVVMSPMASHYSTILLALIQGLVTDVVCSLLKPTIEKPENFCLFAFFQMLIYYGLYFAWLLFTGTVVWTIHLSMGTIIGSALLSLVIAYLLIPAQSVKAEITGEV